MSEIKDGCHMELQVNEDGSQLKRKLIGCSDLLCSPPKRNCPFNNSPARSVMAGVEGAGNQNILNNETSISDSHTRPGPYIMDRMAQNILCEIELSPSKFGKALNEESLRKEMDKIKKRRSSVSRVLLSRKSVDSSNKNKLDSSDSKDSLCQVVEEKGLESITNKPTFCLSKVEANVDPETNQSYISEPKSARILSFDNKTQILRYEFSKWKELKGNRAERICKAEREFKEAKNGDTVIEEDEVMPHLPDDIKSFLFSKPNYEQYLQEVRIAKEQLDLTHDEVHKVLLMYQKVLHVSKLVCEAAFVTIEKETFRDLQHENFKDLLKNMME